MGGGGGAICGAGASVTAVMIEGFGMDGGRSVRGLGGGGFGNTSGFGGGGEIMLTMIGAMSLSAERTGASCRSRNRTTACTAMTTPALANLPDRVAAA